MAGTTTAKKTDAAEKKPHRVTVRRDSLDGKWYVERRTSNGVRLSRSKGYAKLARAEEVGRDLAAEARLEVIPT